MRPGAASLLALAVLAPALAPGCFEPFRVHVDPAILQRVPGWSETPGGIEGGFGFKAQETRYAFDRDADDPPPFSGSLQVFSLRSLGRLDSAALLEQAHDVVARGAEDNDIVLSEGEQAGQRTLVSGVPTHWFVRDGRTVRSGELFEQDVGVYILGEVGHDGRSDTSFVVIAMAQVSRTEQCPLIGPCQPVQQDLQTWIQLVGDRGGSVQGVTSTTGFVDHLVTR